MLECLEETINSSNLCFRMQNFPGEIIAEMTAFPPLPHSFCELQTTQKSHLVKKPTWKKLYFQLSTKGSNFLGMREKTSQLQTHPRNHIQGWGLNSLFLSCSAPSPPKNTPGSTTHIRPTQYQLTKYCHYGGKLCSPRLSLL